MHTIQKNILALAKEHDLSRLPLRRVAELIGREHLSPGVLQHHFNQLEKKSLLFIDRKAKTQRFGEDIEDKRFFNIPIVGAANCGPVALVAEENIEGYIKISKNSLRNTSRKLVAVRASGESMNSAQVPTAIPGVKSPVHDGDYVIVDTENRSLSDNLNKYVLSVIGGMANIKKLVKRQYDIALISESTDTRAYSPIIITETDDFLINGRVVRVFEKQHQ